MIGKFMWLAAVIAAHPNHKVVGRTRLQKTVKLLQRLGAPLDYDYMIHFYGPYSEGVQADIGLLERLGLVHEETCSALDGSPYYVLQASEGAVHLATSRTMKPFCKVIDLMSQADPIILELAATYDAFREMGADHSSALERLRRKKGNKCDGGRDTKALVLLRELGLAST